ncbi:MAG: S24 family peptidase [Eubacteriales bacterium]|nr:S24 family peptidase [Eubacteriales bacterium]
MKASQVYKDRIDPKRADEKILDPRKLEALLQTIGPEGVLPLVCSGSSMTPTFRNNRTILYLRYGKPAAVASGDVLLFKRTDGTPVLHRVLRIIRRNSRTLYEMNGDAQNWTETIEETQIIGYVVGYRRNGTGDKLVQTSDRFYKLRVRLWRILMPVRPLLFQLHAMIRIKK